MNAHLQSGTEDSAEASLPVEEPKLVPISWRPRFGGSILTFVLFAAAGNLLLLSIGINLSTFESSAAALVNGASGLLIIWLCSKLGISPFTDEKIATLERIVAANRRSQDRSSVTVGVAASVQSYLTILEQGARTMQGRSLDSKAVKALLQLQSEGASELRKILREIGSEIKLSNINDGPSCAIKPLISKVERLAFFIVHPRKVSLKTTISPAAADLQINQSVACSAVLAALNEASLCSHAGSVIHLVVEAASKRKGVVVRLVWDDNPALIQPEHSGFYGIQAILQPVRGSLVIPSEMGSKRSLELHFPCR